MDHKYPKDLAAFILHRDAEFQLKNDAGHTCPSSFPDQPTLENILSVCYQASLLREEDRPLKFRVILLDPENLSAESGPPEGFHRLILDQPRPFNEHELRRLSPAVDFHRALIGVQETLHGLFIWGIIQSGPRWLQVQHGGRGTFVPLPPALVVGVTNPSRLTVSVGSLAIATLNGGTIRSPSWDVFDSPWLPDLFAEERDHTLVQHQSYLQQHHPGIKPVRPDFMSFLGRSYLRRVISLMRNARHGGTLLMVPERIATDSDALRQYVALKYPFRDEQPRRRFHTLMLGIMNRLAILAGNDLNSDPVGWEDYIVSRDEQIYRLEEGFSELAHTIASLTLVDGAVVTGRNFELIGFGGEIRPELADVTEVAHAQDQTGEVLRMESTQGVGTRHRSAYRLCRAIPNSVAIVVSQDGSVRFVVSRQGTITYWDQVSLTVLDL